MNHGRPPSPVGAIHPGLLRFSPFSPVQLSVTAYVSRGALHAPAAEIVQRLLQRPRNLRFDLGLKPIADPPLISCLMPTRNRPLLARLAVGSYRRQTWPRRELIILDNGNDPRFARWVESLGDSSIRIIDMRGDSSTSLGEFRNILVGEARGVYICQWDDDDLYHAARLEAQYRALSDTQSQVCLLAREFLWFPHQGLLSVAHRRPHENTLLARKSVMPAFPDRSRAEDTPVVEELLEKHPAVLLDVPALYVYVAHGSNTWTEEHLARLWIGSTSKVFGEAYREAVAALTAMFPVEDYLAALRPGTGRPVAPDRAADG
jgi:hypothetical protein